MSWICTNAYFLQARLAKGDPDDQPVLEELAPKMLAPKTVTYGKQELEELFHSARGVRGYKQDTS